MKSEINLIKNKHVVVIQLFLLLFVGVFFFKTITSALVVLGMFGLLLCCVVIYLYPHLIYSFLLISLFSGYFLVKNVEIGIAPSDVLFIVALLYFLFKFIGNNVSEIDSGDAKAIGIAFGIFAMCAFFSLLFKINTLVPSYIEYGFVKIIKIFQVYLFFWLMMHVIREHKDVKNFLYLFYLLSLLQFPICIYQYFFASSGEDINRGVVGTMSYHHGLIGTFMLIPLGLAVGHFLKTKDIIKKILLLLFSSLFLYMIIISGTRSSLIGLFFSIGIFILMNIRINVKSITIVLSILAITSLLYFTTPVKSLFTATTNSPTASGIDASSLSRLVIWKGGVDFFLNTDLITKLTGIGFGAYAQIPYKEVILNGGKHSFGAHNNYLNALCEVGIFGLIAFLGIFIAILKILHRRFSDPMAKCYFLSTIAMLVSGFTQETFWVTTTFNNLWPLYMIGLVLVIKSTHFQEFKNDI